MTSTSEGTSPLKPGDVVHGFVEGYFGRDHYECFRVEAVGADWVAGRTGGYKPYPIAGAGERLVEACKRARTDYRYCRDMDWQRCDFDE